MKRKTANTLGQIAAILAFLLIGAACGVFIGNAVVSVMESQLPTFQKLLFVAVAFVEIYAAMLLQIIIHEAGHMCAGLMSGYRFLSFRIGSFMWIKEAGKLLLRRHSVAGTGGQCLMLPPEMVDGRFPFVLYNLGGSLMNIISIPIFALLYYVSASIPLLPLLFIMCAIVGAGFALVNGVPLRLGTINNDGCNALELGKDAQALRAFWVQLNAVGKTAEGVRIKDMPEEWFAMPEESGLGNSMTATIAVFRENWLMDKKEFDEAKSLIDWLLERETGIVGLYRSMLTCDRIYLELISGGDAALVDKLYSKELKKFIKQMKNSITVIRTQYAYAYLYEKDADKAERFLEHFCKCAKTYPYPVDVESEQELIAIVKTVDSKAELRSADL